MLFLRCLLLTEMDGLRLCSQQGQRDSQPSWPPPSARPPRTGTFTHGILSRGENEITAEGRAGGEGREEEEEGLEHFADEVVSGFLTPGVLSPYHHIGAAE